MSLAELHSQLKEAFQNEDEAAFNLAIDKLGLFANGEGRIITLPEGWLPNNPKTPEEMGRTSARVRILTKSMHLTDGTARGFRWTTGHSDDILAYKIVG
jgi:hypothetical protein